MDLNKLESIHIGSKISALIKERNISVYGSLSQTLKKTPAGIYKDFEKHDLSLKQVYSYLESINLDFCEFLTLIGFCNQKHTNNSLNEPETQYRSNPAIAAKREIELLNKVLEEKERIIQLLMNNK